jgi:MoaA/NifB/PqqE/SkfB family radical SAM enzyme
MNKVFETLRTLVTRRLVIKFDAIEFAYSKLSNKRIFNWLLAELSYVFRSQRSWAYPTHLQIEPTNECNLRCPVCFITNEQNRLKKGSMSFDRFKRLIDEVGDYLLFLHFWGWGEPFLNRDFLRMIKYAKSKGIKIVTSTNGHFFTDEDKINALLDSDLDVLIVALDGIDRETYEKYRAKGDFDKVISGVKRVAQMKTARGKVLPQINLRTLATLDNEEQIPQIKALAEEIGVDLFSIKTAALNCGDKVELQNRVPRNPEYRRESLDAEGRPVRKKNMCKRLWMHPFILQDGTLIRCDYNTTQLVAYGNVLDEGESLKKVWFGEPMKNARREFIKHHVLCNDCVRNYADADKNVSHIYKIRSPQSGLGGE